ncbi:MarR family transcriptional regulator [Dactylosporangium sp. AC04546]|uniref:MarR family winged helix-turn-helix transcriptional regulator n=1 Tax=Dactylosporangium sp. AC04546 TaxID=2862460 RepID=UPI001EDD2EFF|nr:MarR family transcriptional regulator [Dactylosporangium sp. AC04546]WVK87631.1 MarR family transcriptional regulator [Dactylosporangium sp. AC04546]
MDHQGLADGLAERLNAVRRVWRRRLRAEFVRAPLTGSQVELLRHVEAVPGVGVGAAAQALHLAGNSVSTLVNQLTRDGLLSRERDPDDGRTARLFLTPAAQQRLQSWRGARSALLAKALAELAEEEREALVRALPALDRLAAALEGGAQ